MADWGRALAGFIRGTAAYGAKQLDRRQDEEADLRKARMLAELQRETSDYEYRRGMAEIDDQKTEVDYTTGKKRMYNKRGELVREGEASASDMADYKYKTNKQALDLKASEGELAYKDLAMQNIRSEMASRAHDDALQDLNGKAYRSSLDGTKNSGLHGGPGEDPDLAAAGTLLSHYKNEIEAIKRHGVDPVTGQTTDNALDDVAIRQAALAIVQNSRTGAEAEKAFNQWLVRANKGYAQKSAAALKARNLGG